MIVCVTDSGQGVTIEEVIRSMAIIADSEHEEMPQDQYESIYEESVAIVDAFHKEYGQYAIPYPDGTITRPEKESEYYVADAMDIIRMMLCA